jgi:dTDP-4-dehydrorhamnose 3,5-epimerase
MKVEETPLKGILLIYPTVFEDHRGHFLESYNKEVFYKNGITAEFVQDNQSLSQKGVLRGMHFQNPPFAQGKLVRVIKGSVQDVVIDLRKSSQTYGQSFSYVLTEANKHMMWIPEGFAHGFLTLENDTIFSYKCTSLYNKASEDGILWNDPVLGINWMSSDPQLSEKDKNAKMFDELDSLF